METRCGEALPADCNVGAGPSSRPGPTGSAWYRGASVRASSSCIPQRWLGLTGCPVPSTVPRSGGPSRRTGRWRSCSCSPLACGSCISTPRCWTPIDGARSTPPSWRVRSTRAASTRSGRKRTGAVPTATSRASSRCCPRWWRCSTTSSGPTKPGGAWSWRRSRLAPSCSRTCSRGCCWERRPGLRRRRWSRSRPRRCSTVVRSCPTR